MNRRQYIFLSSGAAIGTLSALQADSALAATPKLDTESGLSTKSLKPLRHAEIPGFLSASQIAPHYSAHYGGALKAFVSVEEEFDKNFQSGAPIRGAAFDRMKQIQSSRGNSVLLHELYFDGLALKPIDPPSPIRSAIETRFGTLERWATDFMDSARTAAGWAVLVIHPINGKLYNVVSDEHAQGPMWLSAPLVVIDVYEHAFYIDYENRKGEYVEKFINFIDWRKANQRYLQVSESG